MRESAGGIRLLELYDMSFKGVRRESPKNTTKSVSVHNIVYYSHHTS